MTEGTRTDLRQADAFVSVEGILSEKKLEMVDGQDGHSTIRGSLVVKTDDTNFVTLNVYVNEFTSNGSPNRAFEGMKTVMEEYKSIAEVGEAEATKMTCRRGNLQPNTYVDKNTYEVLTNVRYSASFVSRVDDATYDPKATFEVEAFIENMVDEVDKNGEPTGRVKINTYVPTYRGVEPMLIIAPEEIASDVMDVFENGQTARFYGDLKNNVIVHENVIKLAIGGSKTEIHREFTNEIILTGASEPYEEEKAYTADAINKGLVERDLRLERDKETAKNAKKTPVTAPGMGAPRTSGTGRPLPRFTM